MNWYAKELEQFIGQTVKSVVKDEEFFGLLLTDGEHDTVIWFLRDDEGNGPGSFDIVKETNEH